MVRGPMRSRGKILTTIDPRQAVLRVAAQTAGAILQSYFGKGLEVHHKGDIDLVTQADREAEQAILGLISQKFPADAIIAEESGRQSGSSAWQWIIDPLDGTTNFASGFPHFGVSIALSKAGQTLAGIVFDPIKEDWFEATYGLGASLNHQPIQVSEETRIGHALTATGFPYDRRQRLPVLLERVGNILNHTRGLRRLGSAALDLAYVACGRLDAFVEDGLNPWDVAAGILLVTEAGGCVTQFDGKPVCMELGEIMATNERLLPDLIQKLI